MHYILHASHNIFCRQPSSCWNMGHKSSQTLLYCIVSFQSKKIHIILNTCCVHHQIYNTTSTLCEPFETVIQRMAVRLSKLECWENFFNQNKKTLSRYFDFIFTFLEIQPPLSPVQISKRFCVASSRAVNTCSEGIQCLSFFLDCFAQSRSLTEKTSFKLSRDVRVLVWSSLTHNS